MNTDNRMNEQLPGNTGQFTEAQVEAAAEAIHNLMQGDPSFKDSGRKREMRIYARAALVAAQGAARPVNGFDTTAERVKTVADSLHVALVLPSSGVDEDALAEVIARVTDLWDDPLDEVHDIPQIARAVAEWLKGQGNAARE